MAAINAVTDLTREGDIAVLTIDFPPVNAFIGRCAQRPS